MELPKDYFEFQESLTNRNPPENWSKILKALWYDANEDWDAAHNIVDGMVDETAKWIHAYLHRKEGDDWNAAYWYRQADKPLPTISLGEEHKEIVKSILDK